MTMPFTTDDSLVQRVEASIQKDVSLATYNTFGFSYQAEYFAVADSLESLKVLLAWANRSNVNITMIGGGSNLLISDHISGLVIINRLLGMKAYEGPSNVIRLIVSAGEKWHQVVEYSVEKSWYGIENLALIPGTVGAAPVQNIGAYGVEIKDVLARVQVIDQTSGDVYWVNVEDCGFAYRDSHFKGKWKNKLIITSVELVLKKQADLLLSYGGLEGRIEGEPTLKKVFDTVCMVRNEKLPNPETLSNAGSYFKNPIVSPEKHDELRKDFPNLVSFPFENQFKLAAGWLIDQAGWKGKISQGVGVYDKQALVLVNYSEKSADALLALEAEIKQSIFERYGVELEREPVQLPTMDVNGHSNKSANFDGVA